MIVFTLWYRRSDGRTARVLPGGAFPFGAGRRWRAPDLQPLHVAGTGRNSAVRLGREPARRCTTLGLIVGASRCSCGGVHCPVSTDALRPHRIDAREVGYALFMSFYGLVFPAYVWLCVIPSPDGHAGPSRRKLWILAAAVAVVGPTFWLAFVERQTEWALAGLILVLLARLLLPRRAPVPPAEADAPPTWRRARQRVFGRRAG